MDSFYVAASASADADEIAATARLPWSIKASEYEVACVNYAFTPSWLTYDDLYCILVSPGGKKKEELHFRGISLNDAKDAVTIVSEELVQQYGVQNANLRIRNWKEKFTLRVKKGYKVMLSKQLAELLGLEGEKNKVRVKRSDESEEEDASSEEEESDDDSQPEDPIETPEPPVQPAGEDDFLSEDDGSAEGDVVMEPVSTDVEVDNSTGSKVLEKHITPTSTVIDRGMYYISCDEMATNFYCNRKTMKCMDAFALNHFSKFVVREPIRVYHVCDGTNLDSLTVRVYKEDGKRIPVNNSHYSHRFYVLLHLRKCRAQ